MSEVNKNSLINMPNEILRKIFSFITDTDTYKNTRLVCQLFHFMLIDVKIFNNNNLYLNFRINKYYDINSEDITIFDNKKSKIGYIKTINPMSVKYYLKKDNTTVEYTMNPNEVITKETIKTNNIIRTNIVVQNLKNKTFKRSTLTNIFPNNGINHPFVPPNIPPNGCIIN